MISKIPGALEILEIWAVIAFFGANYRYLPESKP
jgi:hypothetical protein